MMEKHRSLRMRHQPQDSAIICQNSGNVIVRAVWIFLQVLEFTDFSFGISKSYLPAFFQFFIFFRSYHIMSFAVRNRKRYFFNPFKPRTTCPALAWVAFYLQIHPTVYVLCVFIESKRAWNYP